MLPAPHHFTRLLAAWSAPSTSSKACSAIQRFRGPQRRNESPPNVCGPHVWPTYPSSADGSCGLRRCAVRNSSSAPKKIFSNDQQGRNRRAPVLESARRGIRIPLAPIASAQPPLWVVMAHDLSAPPRDAAPAKKGGCPRPSPESPVRSWPAAWRVPRTMRPRFTLPAHSAGPTIMHLSFKVAVTMFLRPTIAEGIG